MQRLFHHLGLYFCSALVYLWERLLLVSPLFPGILYSNLI